jgi:hypothetical protein
LKPAFSFAARLFAHVVDSRRHAAAIKGLRRCHKNGRVLSTKRGRIAL